MGEKVSVDVLLGKSLAWLLRHGAVKEGLNVRSDGFVDVAEVLAYPTIRRRKFTEQDILRIVEKDQKGRYGVWRSEVDGHLYIKATQGHSFEVKELNLREIVSPEELPMAIHGTYMRSWLKIKAEGLKRMSRNHIHLTSSEVPVDTKQRRVVSGFRSDCEVLIYINIPKAMQAGVKFFLSENNVILTAGINGTISAEFFLKVVNRRTGQMLFTNTSL